MFSSIIITTILVLPLLSSLTLALFGRFLGRNGAIFMGSFTILYSFITSCFFCYIISKTGSGFYINLGEWINLVNISDSAVGNKNFVSFNYQPFFFTCDWEFIVDSLTAIILVVVTGISFIVHVYSIYYIESDPHVVRFYTYLSFFTLFILIFIISNNFLVLFLGWEGVGVISFLLINFWFTRTSANKAAVKAIVVNRISDIFLLAGIGMIYSVAKSLDFDVVFPVIDIILLSNNAILKSEVEYIGLFFIVAAVGKSAQIGLHTWLPDAIEGPTPVSALIHAATIVTAGIVLLLRCSSILSILETTSAIIVLFGILTAFFAASTAIVQQDIKKVIAYSTCSQLGYIMYAIGLHQYNLSLFHLFNHAFFKALLFIVAGSVIHLIHNEQDIRKTGGLGDTIFFGLMAASVGTIALAGTAFFAGFYSKEVIIEVAFLSFKVSSLFLFWLSSTTAVITAIYSSDLIEGIFMARAGGHKSLIESPSNMSNLEFFVFSVLIVLSITTGYYAHDLFIGSGSDFFGAALAQSNPEINVSGHSEYIPLFIKLLPTIFSILIAFDPNELLDDEEVLRKKRLEEEYNFAINYFALKFLFNRWYVDLIQNWKILFPTFKWSYSTFQLLDKYLLEIFFGDLFRYVRKIKRAKRIGLFKSTVKKKYTFFYK